ncbi:MAG: argininosuccinate lyase [Clostridia bacterium]|nr:argininosuccinate lyase [Clostridia bacterium]
MKLWGGRFEKQSSKEIDDFHSSISFDCRLYKEDILGSIAHAEMLGNQGIIPKNQAKLLIDELNKILEDIESGNIKFDIQAEDIHMNIEKILIERIGDIGKKLHTGRSRNDQVALDIRLYLKNQIQIIFDKLIRLESTLIDLSTQNLDTIMPGYTHMQKAQPTTLAHHLMAYFQMFKRDITRIKDCYNRMDEMPLGAGALAATTYPLDRNFVAQKLGFKKITDNSIDSVSDRDFVIEFTAWASITMMHLSRFCEEMIIWSTDEFKFIEIDDSFSTGSSIMPQKKNPDMAELIRGKTGRVYGNLIALLTTMKSLPLAYNKDMQEDKESLFDTVDTIKKCIDVFTDMLKTTKINKDRLLDGAKGGFTNSTDAADYLVKKGVPFRDAHKIIGKLVLYCIKNDLDLYKLTLEEYKNFSPYFEQDIYQHINLHQCVSQREVYGGPAPEQVKISIQNGIKFLEDIKL